MTELECYLKSATLSSRCFDFMVRMFILPFILGADKPRQSIFINPFFNLRVGSF